MRQKTTKSLIQRSLLADPNWWELGNVFDGVFYPKCSDENHLTVGAGGEQYQDISTYSKQNRVGSCFKLYFGFHAFQIEVLLVFQNKTKYSNLIPQKHFLQLNYFTFFRTSS